MKNKIHISTPRIMKNRIDYQYTVEGDWREAYCLENPLSIEYSCDVSGVTESVAVVPLISNLLPLAWILDAEITVSVCDEDFYNSVEAFKKGYKDMYPMLDFKGRLTAEKLERNRSADEGGAISFFSGGVDAFNTLTSHAEEKPTLVTVWGADLSLEDVSGWDRMKKHLEKTAEVFHTDYVTVKSNLRGFLNNKYLDELVRPAGDYWWHGFQHGLGLISHGAPIAYSLGKIKVCFASTFTIHEKGLVTCASDPSIDNYVRFCNAGVLHDGYEYSRHGKIRNIINFSKKNNLAISLRVCWESSGGGNCCECEKCRRTILALYAEKEDPKAYGFEKADMGKIGKLFKKDAHFVLTTKRYYYEIQDRLRKNYTVQEVDKSLKWFYKISIKDINRHPYYFCKRVKNKLAFLAKNLITKA
jgi:hypothetical protein